jgi:hypothetical protein
MAARYWTTPNARDWKDTGESQGTRKSPNLGTMVHRTPLWPTPRAANPGSRPNGKGGKILAEEVAIAAGLRKRGQTWATPTASAGGPEPEGTTGRKLVTQVQQKTQAGGALNPTWVEWLMGWPLGWTDLSVSATDKFRLWLRQHGGFSQPGSSKKPAQKGCVHDDRP